MSKYEEITEARKLLGIPERASMAEIKARYRSTVSRWHPDKCPGNEREGSEMTQKLNAAYRTIMDYCAEYEFSFEKEEIKRYISKEEWWVERFGDGPLWG
ncbi:MAG: J domain-containing protein [Thermodesulfobacteriota bacterium]